MLVFSFLFDGEELRLPVPPLPYGWGVGQTARELTVNGTGTVYLPGDGAAHSEQLEFLLPAREYPFCAPGAVPDPTYYIKRLTAWIQEKKIGRYVVPGMINARVVLEELTYEERDGTGDVTCKLYIKESPALEAVTTEAAAPAGAAGDSGRPAMETAETAQTYTVVSGDCLSVICRRFYGSGTAKYYNALAAYNGIANPHLIFPGQVLTIPPAGQLGVSA